MARKLPHSQQAEQALLGAMLTHSDAIISVGSMIQESDFFFESHQMIYRGILKLSESREQINALLVAQVLEDANQLALVGGMEYLDLLMEMGYQHYMAEEYAQIVREKSIRRQLITAANDIIEGAYEEEDEIKAMERAEKHVFTISQDSQTRDLTSAKEIVEDVREEIQRRQQSGKGLLGLGTRFVDIDEKTNGLQKGNLVLIAARPSMGKTALGMNIAEQAAIENQANVCVFSLEMSKEQLMLRMLSSRSMIPLEKVISGDIDSKQWLDLLHATKVLASANLYIDDTPAITLHEIRSKLRKYKTRHRKLDLVVIDYLQLMSGGRNFENRQLEISNISRGLKEIAKEMECPVIALSQLSREPDRRANHRPVLSDLRESGAIEQDADLVMFIYREAVYHAETADPNKAEIIIAKQRNGETGTVPLTWMGAYTKFQNYGRAR